MNMETWEDNFLKITLTMEWIIIARYGDFADLHICIEQYPFGVEDSL